MKIRKLFNFGVVFLLLLPVLLTGRFTPTQAAGGEVPFGARRVVTTAADGAKSVYAADIDGDGDLDILSASEFDDKIAWYENNGSSPPAFTMRTITTLADNAKSVTAADVDGDGDMDVLSASRDDDTVAWYESNGGSPPAFTRRVITTSADNVKSVYTADLDSDGDMDVLSASRNDHKIAWYENNGASPPVFTSRIITTSAYGAESVYAADVDGDGNLDVLSASQDDSTVAWYESDGASPPTFTRRVITDIADRVMSVYAADVDGDGDLDVLSASRDDDTIAWYQNNGASPPAFSRRVITASADSAHSVYAADVDGDGDMDVLSASYDDHTIAWYENNGNSSPVFTPHIITTSAQCAISVYAADVDGDGDQDVLSASYEDDTIAWYSNQTIHHSAFYPAQAHRVVTTSADGARSVYAADLDSDGNTDVLSASYEDKRITWYESNGSSPPIFTAHIVYSLANNARSVYAADVNGDGDVDILSASEGDNTIAWYENNGGQPPSFARYVITTSASGARSVYAADIDGDGDVDVLSASAYDDVIAWYENNGGQPPSFARHVITASADGGRAVYAADLDNDGDMDVLSASANDDKIAWYENNGSLPPGFTPRVITTNADGAHSVYAADVDGDGDMDVLSASRDDNRIIWYENDSASPPVFTFRIITEVADGAYSVYAADVDNDGDIDVLSASSNDGKIAWYENSGASPLTFTAHTITTAADGADSVYATDLDSDGNMDVLLASGNDDTIAWYENRGGQFALATTNTAPSTIFNGQQDDVLRIVAAHRGQQGDTDAELATLDLLFEENAGDPLSTNETNNLIQNLHIYRDTGSGAFESGVDPLVITVGALSLTAGRQTVVFADGDSDVRLVFGAPVTYFVVTELTGNAAAQTPHQFRVTHVTESSSTAEDRDRDLPLTLEFVSNVASSIVTAVGSSTPTFTPTPTQTSGAAYLPAVLRGYFCDQYEPNDSRATAWGPLTSGQIIHDAKICQGDSRDVYYFDATGSFQVTIDLKNMPANADFALLLWDQASSTCLTESRHGAGQDERIVYTLPGAGRYYVDIYPWSGTGPYILQGSGW